MDLSVGAKVKLLKEIAIPAVAHQQTFWVKLPVGIEGKIADRVGTDFLVEFAVPHWGVVAAQWWDLDQVTEHFELSVAGLKSEEWSPPEEQMKLQQLDKGHPAWIEPPSWAKNRDLWAHVLHKLTRGGQSEDKVNYGAAVAYYKNKARSLGLEGAMVDPRLPVQEKWPNADTDDEDDDGAEDPGWDDHTDTDADVPDADDFGGPPDDDADDLGSTPDATGDDTDTGPTSNQYPDSILPGPHLQDMGKRVVLTKGPFVGNQGVLIDWGPNGEDAIVRLDWGKGDVIVPSDDFSITESVAPPVDEDIGCAWCGKNFKEPASFYQHLKDAHGIREQEIGAMRTLPSPTSTSSNNYDPLQKYKKPKRTTTTADKPQNQFGSTSNDSTADKKGAFGKFSGL